MHDDGGWGSVLGQQYVVEHGRDDVPVDRQRYVVRPVGVQREYGHVLPVFGAVRRLDAPPLLVRRRVVLGRNYAAIIFGAEPLFDLRLELVHGPVG